MVRRAVSSNFGTFAMEVEPEYLKSDLLPYFTKLSQDDQDSVRLLAVDNCVKLASLLSDEESETFVVPTVRASGGDKSWRVRYCTAEKFSELSQALGPLITRSELVGLFVRLLKDSEAEVRGVAAKQVTGVASTGVPLEMILNQVLPCVEELTNDASQHVRAALAEVIMGLAPIVGKEHTTSKLVPLYLQLLKDEFPDVKLAIISHLDDVNKVIGIESLQESLLPAVFELARDTMWRVRLAIMEYMPILAKQLGQDAFVSMGYSQHDGLHSLCLSWLEDQVHSIRTAACENLSKLAQVLGADWAMKHFVPQLKVLVASPNYLSRLTTLNCISALADGMPAEYVEQELLKMAIKLADDPVPNVRFNVSRTLSKISKTLTPGAINEQVKPALMQLKADNDPDVQYFSEKALAECA